VQGVSAAPRRSCAQRAPISIATAAEVWRDLFARRGHHGSAPHRAAHRRDLEHPSIGRRGRHAYHMAGATAVFNANRFERRFRDMHAIAQQIQGRDAHYEDVGKAILSAISIRRRRCDDRSVVLRTGAALLLNNS
jgi:hypothetical protein